MRSINYYVRDVAVIMWRMQSLEQGQSRRTGKNAVCHTDTVSGGGCSCDSYARINRVVPCPGYKNKLIERKKWDTISGVKWTGIARENVLSFNETFSLNASQAQINNVFQCPYEWVSIWSCVKWKTFQFKHFFCKGLCLSLPPEIASGYVGIT